VDFLLWGSGGFFGGVWFKGGTALEKGAEGSREPLLAPALCGGERVSPPARASVPGPTPALRTEQTRSRPIPPSPARSGALGAGTRFPAFAAYSGALCNVA